MQTQHKTRRGLRTIWRIPDDLWAELQPILPPEKPPGTRGRPVVPFRQITDGILYVLRTGCQWKALPREYGSGSTCHRRFQAWVKARIFKQFWAKLLTRYDDLESPGRFPAEPCARLGVGLDVAPRSLTVHPEDKIAAAASS